MGNSHPVLPPPFTPFTSFSLEDVEEVVRRYHNLSKQSSGPSVPVLSLSTMSLVSILSGASSSLSCPSIVESFVKGRQRQGASSASAQSSGEDVSNPSVSSMAVLSVLIMLCSAPLPARLAFLFSFLTSQVSSSSGPLTSPPSSKDGGVVVGPSSVPSSPPSASLSDVVVLVAALLRGYCVVLDPGALAGHKVSVSAVGRVVMEAAARSARLEGNAASNNYCVTPEDVPAAAAAAAASERPAYRASERDAMSLKAFVEEGKKIGEALDQLGWRTKGADEVTNFASALMTVFS